MYYQSAFLRGKNPPFTAVLKYKDSKTGKWRQLTRVLESKNITEAKRDMFDWRMRLEHERKMNENNLNSNITLVEYIGNYIDKRELLKSLEKQTIHTYRYCLKNIRPFFKEIEIAEVTTEQVELWEAQLLEDLSPVTVRKMHVFLKSIFEDALARGFVKSNPMVRIKAPKLMPRMPNALTNYERKRLLTHLDNGIQTPINLGIFIALSTGMRQGEICALRWGDIDIKSGFIWVRYAIARDNGSYYMKQPKTPSSIRDIPITAQLAEALIQRKQKHERDLASLGINLVEANLQSIFVLGEVDGSFLAPIMLSKSWKALAESMGILGTQNKRPTFHDLRHTFATYAISEGIDIKTVSSILGHANAAMTLNIYASADPDSKRAAAQTIDRVMSQRLSPDELCHRREKQSVPKLNGTPSETQIASQRPRLRLVE